MGDEKEGDIEALVSEEDLPIPVHEGESCTSCGFGVIEKTFHERYKFICGSCGCLYEQVSF